jgi:transposase
MMWTALPRLPQHDLRVGRKESDDEAGHDDWIGYSEVRFLVHGVDAAGHKVLRQKLSRSRVPEFFAKLPRCLVGIEACASSHYWTRELITQGHEVKLMLAQ